MDKECKHCLIAYYNDYYAESREFEDDEYCPTCKKAIVEALAKMPKKFIYKDVETNEVGLETLLKWEKENQEEMARSGGIQSIRVLVGTRNLKTGEHDVVREVVGREDMKGRIYIYKYWSSDRSQQRITVEGKVNIKTGEFIRHKIRK